MTKPFRIGQSAWWGSYIVEVRDVDALGYPTRPTWMDERQPFKPGDIRHLGFPGYVKKWMQDVVFSKSCPRLLKLWVYHSLCPDCRSWVWPGGMNCPSCGELWRYGYSHFSLMGMWISIYMGLWLSHNGTLSKLGSWLMTGQFVGGGGKGYSLPVWLKFRILRYRHDCCGRRRRDQHAPGDVCDKCNPVKV